MMKKTLTLLLVVGSVALLLAFESQRRVAAQDKTQNESVRSTRALTTMRASFSRTEGRYSALTLSAMRSFGATR
jgi:hypothetical protein